MNFFLITMTILLYVGCKPESTRKESAPSGKTTPGNSTSPSGTIKGHSWVMARGLAYVSPSRPETIAIDLFDKNGPTSCEVSNGEVWHANENENGAVGLVSISIPRKSAIPGFPYKSPSPIIGLGYSEASGARNDPLTVSSSLEITAINGNQIEGSFSVEAADGSNASGSFLAEFCKNSQM